MSPANLVYLIGDAEIKGIEDLLDKLKRGEILVGMTIYYNKKDESYGYQAFGDTSYKTFIIGMLESLKYQILSGAASETP